MNVRFAVTTLPLLIAGFVIACSGSTRRSGFESSADPTDPSEAGPSFINGEGGVGNTSCASNNTETDGDKDIDGDGFPLKLDCNECDPNVNEGAFDVPGNGLDEDCDGTPDNEVTECDTGLALEAVDAFEGAKAIGLCKKATNDHMWGVVEAKWVRPDGTDQGSDPKEKLSEGILQAFGVNVPQAGKTMLALSSGSARQPGDTGYNEEANGITFDKGYSHGTPSGYPKSSPACGGGFGSFGGANDGVALRVKVRVPSNAKSFKYQENFFTYEFPTFICSNYNDFFVTMMDPKPAKLPDGNIAFDQDGNPISVNNSLLQVCTPKEAGGKNFTCPLGPDGLQGTGFDTNGGEHAATGWLTTTAPVEDVRGKEITLMWTIWDQGDNALDSTVLIDDFSWSVAAADGTKTKPSTPK